MVSAPGDSSTFPQMHLTTSVVIIKSLTFFQWPPLIIPFNSDSLFDGKKLPRSDPRFITLKSGLKFFLTEHFFPILLFLFVCLFVFVICMVIKVLHILDSGINVGPTFINFEFFSRPYCLFKRPYVY